MVDFFFFYFFVLYLLFILRIYFCDRDKLKEQELYNEYNNVVVIIGPSSLSQRKVERVYETPELFRNELSIRCSVREKHISHVLVVVIFLYIYNQSFYYAHQRRERDLVFIIFLRDVVFFFYVSYKVCAPFHFVPKKTWRRRRAWPCSVLFVWHGEINENNWKSHCTAGAREPRMLFLKTRKQTRRVFFTCNLMESAPPPPPIPPPPKRCIIWPVAFYSLKTWISPVFVGFFFCFSKRLRTLILCCNVQYCLYCL